MRGAVSRHLPVLGRFEVQEQVQVQVQVFQVVKVQVHVQMAGSVPNSPDGLKLKKLLAKKLVLLEQNKGEKK